VPPGSTRRLARRLTGLVVGLALPTAFFTWVLGFDELKKRVNGRIWCAGADDVALDVALTSSGSSTRIADTLVCQADGVVVRTVSNARMMATNIGVAFVISLTLLLLLAGCLWVYSRLRRR
jgi:hypothetical protein